MTIAANGDTDLSGNVAVRTGSREMLCDHLSYTALTQALKLTGTVRYEDPTLRVSADAGDYSRLSAHFTHAQFELLQHAGRGTAESVVTNQPGIVELNQVSYTTCPKGTADWNLQAQRLTLDTKALRGTGRGVRIFFKGVPILPLPWISFPLSSARQSGFLFPAFGHSSRSGATVSVPWYWNMAPNQDLTVSPTVYTSRGVDLGAEYRLLTPFGHGSLRANFMPNDRISHQDRSWLRLNTTAHFADRWRVQINAENVSDTQYFEDFADSPQATSTAFVPRDLRVSTRGDVWRLQAQVSKYQSLLGGTDRPYAQLPRLSAAAHWLYPSGVSTSFETELTDFQRDTGTTGWRSRVQPGISYEFTRPGFYLRPRLNWDLTTYRLDLPPAPAASSPTRSLPIVTVDSAVQLVRESGSGAARLITLEPRLSYVYIPYRDQSALPVFDSGRPDPNFVALFRANRYVGFDRVGEANNLTLGLTTRMLQASTGQQYLSATLGQSLQLARQRLSVTLPGEIPDTAKRSDLIATTDLAAYRNWNLHYDLAWNPQHSETEKSLLSLQYRPSGVEVINVGYRFARGSVTQASVAQAEASAAWPIARRWDLYGREVYSFLARGTLESFAGLQYRENCWGIRFVLRNAVSNRLGAAPGNQIGARATSWFLQLELKGLSNVGSGADAFLQGSIQGYSSK